MICRVRWSNMVGWNIHDFFFIFGDDTGHLIWLAVNPPLLCVYALLEMRCVQPGVNYVIIKPNLNMVMMTQYSNLCGGGSSIKKLQ